MDAELLEIIPRTVEQGFPARESTRDVHDEQDLHRAIEAYRFFYPTVSTEGIFQGARDLGLEDGKHLMVLNAAPHHVVFTANSDTPYASGVLDLKRMGPVVIDVPAGPFIGLVNDHHQRWITDLGLPGPDEGKGGKYLLLPPDFSGAISNGYHVARSSTFLALVAFRAIPVAGDVAGALSALGQLKIHPLSKPASVLEFVDVSDRPMNGSCLRWEDTLEYWKVLHRVIDAEPTLEEFRPMYGELAALGIVKGRPFAPDARLQRILERASCAALDELRVDAFASARPDRIVWKDRQWEWVGLVPGNGNFETENFIDLEARDRWFYQAILASPAMFRRRTGSGSIYFLAARDQNGDYLDGGSRYSLTIPQPVPASLFWSVTAYDAETRSQVRTVQKRAVLGSLHDRFEPDADGSVTIHFGPSAPRGHEGQWLQTTPGSGFFLYFRIYGPEAPGLDGSWRLGDVTAEGEGLHDRVD